MIPRLRVNRGREEEDTTASRIDVTKSRQASRLPRKVQLPEIPRRHPQPTRLLSFDYDSEENDSEREMDADQKIVAVLDKIQEVILGNMSNKFNGATKHIREATTDLCLFAAEDIKGMRGESGEHGKGLVHLEEKYARFGRQIRNGFDEQNKINEDIDKRLRQAILDHDKHGLSRKMPKTLASRPKIFQSLTP
ncbi:hypothetical protein JB92DRAFT_3040835 [Gautieria morchelliformis]|nr:hypothetical protein JB92DRAFT_3040835 [Gautieria morchelliformis]